MLSPRPLHPKIGFKERRNHQEWKRIKSWSFEDISTDTSLRMEREQAHVAERLLFIIPNVSERLWRMREVPYD